MNEKKWHVEYAKPIELIEHESNPRKITKERFELLKKRIESQGFRVPPTVDNEKVLLAGHQRVRALIDAGLGDEPIPIVVPDFEMSESDKREILAADNISWGEFDFDILANQFEFDDLMDWGFTKEDLFGSDPIILDPEEPTKGDDDIPDRVKEITVLGDVFDLGSHRLVCGDSTNITDVESLLDGQKAKMVYTDPPYGVKYQSNMRKKNERFDVIQNDDVILDICPIVDMFSTGFIFIWTSWKVLAKWVENTTLLGDMTNMIIWNKGGGGLGDLDKTFSSDYEIAMVWHRDHSLSGGRIGSVWDVGKDASVEYKHPTQKPVALAVMAIDHCSVRSDIVLDLFLGSGSTLIACEKTSRRCYGMELDPKYCDVIVKRYIDFCAKNEIECVVKRNGEDCIHEYS